MRSTRITSQLWNIWTWLTDGTLCLLLITMVMLACVQIFLRTFFSGGFLWADTLLRYLVLWGGLLGAVVATREGKHIAIDVIMYMAPEKIKNWVRLVIHLFASSVAAILTWASIVFVRNEAMYDAGSLLSVPSWIWNLIFPIAFGLITFHFLVALLLNILALFGIRLSQATRNEPDTASE